MKKISIAVVSMFAVIMWMGSLAPVVLAEEIPEIIKENEKNGFSDKQITVQINEKFFEDMASDWPLLYITIASIIGGVIVAKFRIRRQHTKFPQDYDYEDNSMIKDLPMTENFIDLQKESQIYEYSPDKDKIIESRVHMILTLQENKIGDYEKLEDIKKSLICDGSFNLEDSIYLETKYQEFKKIAKKDLEKEVAQ